MRNAYWVVWNQRKKATWPDRGPYKTIRAAFAIGAAYRGPFPFEIRDAHGNCVLEVKRYPL